MPPKTSELSSESISGIDDAVRSSLARSPYRRLSNTPEAEVDLRVLCQSIHINRLEGEPKLLLGDEEEGSWMHSVSSLGPVLDELGALGIRRIYLGLGAADPTHKPRENLDRFVEIVSRVRRMTGTAFELLVDPAGLCMRQDLRWGVTAPNGDVDAQATAELLAQAAVELNQAGMDALVTIGRLNCEVEVARAALARAGAGRVKIMSFSTNSETASAYFDKTRNDITRARTGQKILVGNGHEMTLRALGDFGEGADVIVQKPIEATHSVVMLRMLATGQLSPISYLDATPEIQRMLADNPWLQPAIDRASKTLLDGSRPLRTGGYEVSGTYCMTHTLMRTYSDQLAWAMLDEVYRNLSSAAGSTMEILISRSASWYVRQRNILS